MDTPQGIVDAVLAELGTSGRGAALGLAWARALPTALAVPAFGAPFLSWSLRAAIGFGLATCIAPALGVAVPVHGGPWPLTLAAEVLRGTPVAIAAATAVYAASIAGGVADTALGHVNGAPGSGVRASFSVLLGLAASILFLDGGGAARVASALASPELDVLSPLHAAALDLARGVGIGAMFAAPLLLVAVVLDVTVAVASRELPSLRAETVLPPLRSLVVLVAFAALFERIAEGIALFERVRP